MDSSLKKVISNISVLILSVGFLGVGMVKLVNHPPTVESFDNWGMPLWSIYLIGIYEILLALALFYKPSRRYAIYATAIHMIGALSIHILHQEHDQYYGPIMVIVLLVSLYLSEK